MKIFSPAQVRAWDAYTIAHEPIASLDLMNRVSRVFADWLMGYFPDTTQPVYVFVGPGNNGGDGGVGGVGIGDAARAVEGAEVHGDAIDLEDVGGADGPGGGRAAGGG